MKCDECGESFVGAYIQYEGMNLCERDFEVFYFIYFFLMRAEWELFFPEVQGKVLSVRRQRGRLVLHGQGW